MRQIKPFNLEDPKATADNLRKMRKLSKLTQEQLAEKLGKSVNWVSLIERNRQRPKLDAVLEWADACGFPGGKIAFVPKNNPDASIRGPIIPGGLPFSSNDLVRWYGGILPPSVYSAHRLLVGAEVAVMMARVNPGRKTSLMTSAGVFMQAAITRLRQGIEAGSYPAPGYYVDPVTVPPAPRPCDGGTAVARWHLHNLATYGTPEP